MTQNGKIISICHISIVLIGFVNNLITDDISYNAFTSLSFFKNLQYKIITMPELYIAMIILLSYSIFLCLYEYIIKKKVTEEQENGDKTRKKIINIPNIIVICVSVLFVLLSSLTLITTKTGDIPEVSDGKYLDIHDFGIADKITATGYHHGNEYSPNKITHRKTLSAQMWITHEHYDINDKSVIVFQDVIKYKSQKTALHAAELLVSEKYKNYEETMADGFEKVYISSEDIVAVIENTTYRLTYISSTPLVPTSEHLLDAILEKHNNSMNLSD